MNYKFIYVEKYHFIYFNLIFTCIYYTGWPINIMLNRRMCHFFFFFFFFLGRHIRQVEVPRLGVELELLLLTYATATAIWGQSCICHLHHSSQQCWILNPLSKARDQTCILVDTSQFCYPLSHTGTPWSAFLFMLLKQLENGSNL